MISLKQLETFEKLDELIIPFHFGRSFNDALNSLLAYAGGDNFEQVKGEIFAGLVFYSSQRISCKLYLTLDKYFSYQYFYFKDKAGFIYSEIHKIKIEDSLFDSLYRRWQCYRYKNYNDIINLIYDSNLWRNLEVDDSFIKEILLFT